MNPSNSKPAPDFKSELVARLDRIEHKLDQLAKALRAAPPTAEPPPRPRPQPRLIKGRWHVWGGEGTGWILWLNNHPPPGAAK